MPRVSDVRPPLLILVFSFLGLLHFCTGHPIFYIFFSPSQLPSQSSIREENVPPNGRVLLKSESAPSSNTPQNQFTNLRIGSSPAPAPSAIHSGPSLSHKHRHRGHHHHHAVPVVAAPSPLEEQGCGQICVEPLTSTTFGSPCGCVLPMRVRLLLDVALYGIFPVMNELEIEVASGTYLTQSQVKIMGASADSQNQGQTIVDINLVPLGEEFDNTTALLIYERFWEKKVPLNASLFGDYQVVYVLYTGLPKSPPSGQVIGSEPMPSVGDLPISANFSNKNSRINVKSIAIISFSVFVVLVVLVGALSFILKWRRSGKPSTAVGPSLSPVLHKRYGGGSIYSSSIASSISGSFMSPMTPSMLSVKIFTLGELERATEKFSSTRVLGEGGFGRVYRGVLDDGTEIAVKLLKRDHQNGDRELIAEVEMLSRLHHRNLVKLIGVCIERRTRCLVYELVRNGSVESHLHGSDKSNGPLDWDGRMKIAMGAARGLAYLHEDSNPRVIHRDFKASNVLLEEDFTPKVSDFGLAREATEGSQHISTRVMGTFGYVAPEYAMTGHLLVKSDVYSFGVVLLELLTGRKPVDMSQPQGQESLVTWARPLLTSREGVEQLVDPSLDGAYDFDHVAKVASIASMCVHLEVSQRPFMGEVVQALKLIYNDADETCGDYCSQKDSSVRDSDFKVDFVPSDSSWWNAGGDATPRLIYGQASSFVAMECSSELQDDAENRAYSASSFMGEGGLFLPIRHGNRSGPLRTIRIKPGFNRLRGGSVSEHGGLLPRQPPSWNDRDIARRSDY
ncbi:hypothetical protein MLD38_012381 [Melastoma candidum]|uniref:Uncharacterized protein n=1 Tax=Melastoma candidum TaxID=119954 RepID=A0ACB9REK8_9MYRT|nr:hypothetical protein MLD38_012381 [Melastoma candidum]